MDFRTVIKPLDCQGTLRHGVETWTVGSCFSDSIGQRLRRQMFQVRPNPLGTLFNPVSIERALRRVLTCATISEDSLVESQQQWHSMDFHSSFSSSDKQKVVAAINSRVEALHARLPELGLLVVTFGSAMAHRYLPTGEVAGNCHKIPASQFAVEEIGVAEIAERWKRLLSELSAVATGLKVVLTVSPVRHLAYGAAVDKRSKARLLLAADEIVRAFPDRAIYFPAYEIMDDDLRDYRFYAPDMVHPSEQAADYIHALFLRSFCDPQTARLADECLALTRRFEHRPMTDSAEAIEKFRQATDSLAHSLYSRYPFLKQSHDIQNS